MRLRAALLAGLVLGLTAARPAAAADAQGRFAVKGVGQARCQDFRQALATRSPQLGAMLSWIAGYLSAANRYEPRTYDLVAWQDELYVVSAIENYCRANPNAELATMTRAMIRSLGGQRIAAASPMRTVAVAGRTFQIYGEIIRRAKLRLRAMNLYRGPIDQNADPAFISAIAAFQRRQKLAPTGAPDQDTLFRLLTG